MSATVEQSIKPEVFRQNLAAAIDSYPAEWALTPLRGNKTPYRVEWQSEPPLSLDHLQSAVLEGEEIKGRRIYAEGIGLRTGKISGNIVALDLDGFSAIAKQLELSGGERVWSKPVVKGKCLVAG